MAREDVEDEVCLEMRTGVDTVEKRWWKIVQPPPSVAFALRGRIGSALGAAVDAAMRSLYAVADPEGEDDIVATTATLGDAAALQAFRRARSGRAIAEPGEALDITAGRLLAVAGYVARYAGVRMDSALLLGEHERTSNAFGYKWSKPSLLHRLLLDSGLTYGGSAKSARYPLGRDGEDHPGAALWKAYNTGSVNDYIREIDSLVSGPDELTLLVVWCVMHLWRPF